MSRPLASRIRAILDRLDLRIEDQTMRKGADAPHVVSVVSAYHSAIGRLERRLGEGPHHGGMNLESFAAHLRILRRIVRDHALMVAMRGLELTARERAARRQG